MSIVQKEDSIIQQYTQDALAPSDKHTVEDLVVLVPQLKSLLVKGVEDEGLSIGDLPE